MKLSHIFENRFKSILKSTLAKEYAYPTAPQTDQQKTKKNNEQITAVLQKSGFSPPHTYLY